MRNARFALTIQQKLDGLSSQSNLGFLHLSASCLRRGENVARYLQSIALELLLRCLQFFFH